LKIRIVSNGHGPYTRVENAETGEPLENVTAIGWKINAGGLGTAIIEVVVVPVNITTDAQIKELQIGS
jgi:hypothetical protein